MLSALDWFFTVMLVSIYIVCLFTVCMLTFRKGYILLGILGIFLPFLWIIGAILPARPGSGYARDREIEQQQYAARVTQ